MTVWDHSTGRGSSHLHAKGMGTNMPWISDLANSSSQHLPLALANALLADLPGELLYNSHSEMRLAAQKRARIDGLLPQIGEATPKEEISKGKPSVSEVNL